MAGVNDLAPHLRGTVEFGGFPFHYKRSVLNGQVYPHPGPDTRDWSKIDAGAIDYADVAAMEHHQNPDGGPEVHDGPRIKAACPVCNGAEGAVPTGRDMNTPAARLAALRSLAAQGNEQAQAALAARDEPTAPAGDTLIMPTMTPERQAQLDAQEAQRAADAEAQRIQALADQAAKAQIKAGGDAEAIILAQRAGAGSQAATAELEKAVSAQEAGVTGAADPAFNAGVPPTDPDVVAGATPDVQEQAIDALHGEGAVAAIKEAFATTPEGTLPEGMGRDPWTKEVVKITRNPGADADAPYGRKGNNEPRRRAGSAKTPPNQAQ